MKAVVAAFNQEKALVGAFSVITNLRMELFEALIITLTMYLHRAHTCSGNAAAYSWHRPPPMEWPTSTAELQPRWTSNLHTLSLYLYGIYQPRIYTIYTKYLHSTYIHSIYTYLHSIYTMKPRALHINNCLEMCWSSIKAKYCNFK